LNVKVCFPAAATIEFPPNVIVVKASARTPENPPFPVPPPKVKPSSFCLSTADNKPDEL
jgi:hypothetical protein